MNPDMPFIRGLLIVFLLISFPVHAVTKPFLKGSKIVSGDCNDGYGKIIWPDGQPKGTCPGKTYEGYFKNGLPNGYGKLFFPSTGCIYFGEFKDGKEDGIGTLRWPNGQGYTGEYENGKPAGAGISVTPGKDLRIARTGSRTGLTLLANGELKREDIYGINPTIATGTPGQVVIPETLDQCFDEMKKMLRPEFIEEMRRGTAGEMIRFHFGLGSWMRNNWGLWKGSSLAKWFSSKGVDHPDTMSEIILEYFWRHLHNVPVDWEGRLKRYEDAMKDRQSHPPAPHPGKN